MLRILHIVSLSALLVTASLAWSALHAAPLIATTCLLSPKIETEPKPQAAMMHPFNNLAHPPGKFLPAPGQSLLLEGLVQDAECRPVADALVQLWQMDAAGNYTYPTQRVLNSPAPVFAGSGRVRTDQFGRFRFVTVFPGTAGDLAPYVNLAITAPGTDYASRVYFGGDLRNADDPVLNKLSTDQQRRLLADTDFLPDGSLRAHITTTIDARPRFRHY